MVAGKQENRSRGSQNHKTRHHHPSLPRAGGPQPQPYLLAGNQIWFLPGSMLNLSRPESDPGSTLDLIL
jgi:hypothetical protein